MLGPKEFAAYKQSTGKEVLSVSGTEADIAEGVLDALLPLGPLDYFQMNVGDDFDLAILNERITFTNEPYPDGSDYYFETIAADQEDSQTFELYFQEGEIFRRAIVFQGHKVWQVVGYEVDGKVVTILQEAEERYSSNREIPGGKEIASFDWHSDGPGPVSWDGSNSIYSVGSYWLYCESGDMPSGDVLSSEPKDTVAEILDWLETVNALNLFVIQKTVCNWTSQDLKDRLGNALFEASEFAKLSVYLDEESVKSLVERIRKSDPELDEVAKVLETPDHPLAEHLVAIIEEDSGGYPFWANSPIWPELESRANPEPPPEKLRDYWEGPFYKDL